MCFTGEKETDEACYREIKAHAENINLLFSWAAENGIKFSKEQEGKLRWRFDVKVKPHGTLDLYEMAAEAKTDAMLTRAIINLASGETNDFLDGVNTLLLIAFVRGNLHPAGEVGAPGA